MTPILQILEAGGRGPEAENSPQVSLRDRFGRVMQSLRLSVTDRCNLRCTYCMPAEGVPWQSTAEHLDLAEMKRALGLLAGLGIQRVKITGGEALLRPDLEEIVALAVSTPGVAEVSLTTNGLLLKSRAAGLARAGLKRLTVSLDSLEPEAYRSLTRGGKLSQVLEGLAAAEAAGLSPLKINSVVMAENDSSLLPLAATTLTKDWEVRFIEYMPVTGLLAGSVHGGVTQADLRRRLEDAYGPLSAVEHSPHAPAKSFRFEGARGRIGFISSVSEKFCAQCDRLRLSATGFLRLCMANPDGLDLKPLLRSDRSGESLSRSILEAVWEKPEGHAFERGQSAGAFMSQVGG
jgi:cyclic pyranopterin phosphate synthase